MSLNTQLVNSGFEYKEQNPQYEGQPFDQELAMGPTDDRRCTDLLCCILYLAFWAGLIVIAVVAFTRGNPDYIIYPFDSTGSQCGISPGYQNFKYVYFNQFDTKQFCCIDSCPTISNFTNSNCRWGNANIPCASFGIYNTTKFIDVCYPQNSTMASAVTLGLNGFEQGVSDMAVTWPIELSVLFMAVILGVFFMFMIKCCGGCLVWSLIIGFFAVTAGFGGFCFYMYENPSFAQDVIQDKDLGNLQGLMWLAIGIWTIDVIALLIFICFFKSIRIAIAVIKATAAFIDERLMVISVPFIMFGWIAIYFSLWVLVSAYIYSSGTPAGSCNGSPYGCVNWDNTVKGCLAYYIIGLFWVSEYTIALCQYVIGSTAAYWYFSNVNEKHKGSSHVCKSFMRGIIHHSGSLAFGSLVLIIVWIIQIFFEILHKCGKEKSMSGGAQNGCAKCCIGYTRCALACFQRFMRFLSKNAFIMMAIKGGGFCESAHDAFYLIMRTKAAYAITESASSLVTHFGKLVITVICTLCGFLMITNISYFADQLYSPVAPTIVFFTISFVIASLFMDVFGTGSDTMLLCYALELDIHKGATRSCPTHLQTFFTGDPNK